MGEINQTDIVDQVENSISFYRESLDNKNGRAARAQQTYIEQNCITWLSQLVLECKVHREFGMTVDTVAMLTATQHGELLKLVYVCSPYKGNKKVNIATARQYCLEAIAAGYIPIAPHVMFYGTLDDDDPGQRAVGMKIGLELLCFCQELWVCGNRISDGMRGEIALAEALKILVRRMSTNEIL